MNIVKWSHVLYVGLFLALLYPFCLSGDAVYQSSRFEIQAEAAHKDFAKGIAKPLEVRLADLHRQIGIYPTQSAQFIIVRSKADYQKLTQGKEGIIQQSRAFYLSSTRHIYLRGPEQVTDNYLKILIHEYMHWYVDYIFGSAPLWFHEGMAVEYAQQMSYERYYHFLRSRFIGSHFHLNEMYYTYPKSANAWDLFYSTSAIAIRYMKQGKHDAWQRFWNNAADNYRHAISNPHADPRSFSNSLYVAYGLSANAFAEDFGRYAKHLSYQYIFMAINALVLALLPLVLIIGYTIRKKRLRSMPDMEILSDVEIVEEDVDGRDVRE